MPTTATISDTTGALPWVDPLWRVTVHFTDLERALLATWTVRRLGLIAHGGAASLVTAQSTTRLEHSLGALALVAHFAPEDRVGRVAGLLHDIGHGPFSHTLEGVASTDHHELGRVRFTEVVPLIAAHGLHPEEVANAMAGRPGTAMARRGGVLGLDHLDGLARSSQSHGRLRRPAWELLADLGLDDGAVTADAAAGAELMELALDEARDQGSPVNLAAIAVLREAVATLGTELPETDHELLATLLADERTAPRGRLLLTDPGALALTPSPSDTATVQLRRRYLDGPLVDGQPLTPDRMAVASLPALGGFTLA